MIVANPSHYRPDIDGLRAVAVLAVIAHHVDPALLPGGFLGVDIFFVISGYLISSILFREQSEGRFSFANFYGRRIRRLFPSLFVVVAACLAAGYWAMFSDEYERLGRHASSAIGFFLNFQLMGEAGYFDAASYTKPLLHLWSLSVEEQFYLIWPVLLVLFRQLRMSLTRAIAFGSLLSFVYALWLSGISRDTVYYHPIARFWELLAGAALALVHYQRPAEWMGFSNRAVLVRNVCSSAGLILICSALVLFDKKLLHPGFATLWPIAGSVTLIAAGPSAWGGRLLAMKPFVMIGLISYPLYLWHWPLLSFVRVTESGKPVVWLLWLSVVLAVMMAFATYRWIELPVRLSSARRGVMSALCGGMVLLLGASLTVSVNHGFPDRASLASLKKHQPQLVREARQDQSCIDLFQGGRPPTYCRQHRPGRQMIALIGDSHAHALFPGVADLAGKHGYGTLLLANSGCPTLAGTVMGRTASEKQQCAQDIENILNAVSQDKRVVSVVLVSRGPQYLTGTGFGAVEAGYNYPPISLLRSRPSDASDPVQAFSDGLANTASLLHLRGKRVSYLLQIPELGVPAGDCIGRPFVLLPRKGCTVPFSDYQQRMQDYRTLATQVQNRLPYLQLINAEQVFCRAAGCSGLIDGELLYADDNHLSILGSRRVAPLVLGAAKPSPPPDQPPMATK